MNVCSTVRQQAADTINVLANVSTKWWFSFEEGAVFLRRSFIIFMIVVNKDKFNIFLSVPYNLSQLVTMYAE